MEQMKKKNLIIIGLVLIFTCQASANWIGVNGMNVVPSQPINTDLITFNISGWAAGANSWVDHDVFSHAGTSLLLDLYIDVGMGGVGSSWGFSKQIQSLTPGTYSLEVRTFDWQFGSPEYGTVQDTENLSFTVTPEPCTLVLFALGLPFLRSLKRKN